MSNIRRHNDPRSEHLDPAAAQRAVGTWKQRQCDWCAQGEWFTGCPGCNGSGLEPLPWGGWDDEFRQQRVRRRETALRQAWNEKERRLFADPVNLSDTAVLAGLQWVMKQPKVVPLPDPFVEPYRSAHGPGDVCGCVRVTTPRDFAMTPLDVLAPGVMQVRVLKDNRNRVVWCHGDCPWCSGTGRLPAEGTPARREALQIGRKPTAYESDRHHDYLQWSRELTHWSYVGREPEQRCSILAGQFFDYYARSPAEVERKRQRARATQPQETQA